MHIRVSNGGLDGRALSGVGCSMARVLPKDRYLMRSMVLKWYCVHSTVGFKGVEADLGPGAGERQMVLEGFRQRLFKVFGFAIYLPLVSRCEARRWTEDEVRMWDGARKRQVPIYANHIGTGPGSKNVLCRYDSQNSVRKASTPYPLHSLRTA